MYGWHLQTRVEDVYTRVIQSINAGYRFFDGAQVYRNEAEVGLALKTSFEENLVQRHDIFVSSKVLFHV